MNFKWQIGLLILLFNIINPYTVRSDEDPNEISDYFKYFIEKNEMRPLSLLEKIDKEKFDIIIKYLPNNEIVENYYYHIIIHIRINRKETVFFSPEEYDSIKHLSKYKNKRIERIEYAIWHYEAFLNKYKYTRGSIGKCFSIAFSSKNEFIGRYFWR